MDFIVNEKGCNNLMAEMQKNLSKIMGLVSELEDHDRMLKAALGDDYDAIARSVRKMTGQLNNAYAELNVIISCTSEYMSKVGQVRASLG